MGKIANIKLEKTETPFKRPFHVTNSVQTVATNITCKITLDNGVVGLGEASPSFRVNGEVVNSLLAMEGFLNDFLKGLDVSRYRAIFEKTSKLLSAPSLRAGIEFAILDAYSKELGIKPYKLLGGSETKLETDKTVSIGSLEERLEEAKEIIDEGFRIMKVKVGEDLKEDIEAMTEIAKLKSGMRFIIDANMGYTPKEAVFFIKEMYRQGIDVAIFEQPVRFDDFEGLKYVRFHSDFPVAADESIKTPYDALRLIKEEAVDFFNIKIMKSGISHAITISEIAKAKNIGLMIGAMAETSTGITQSVHLALGLGGFKYFDLDTIFLLDEKEFKGDFIIEKPFYRVE